jgi:protein-L-isoaspartate(D-aspartate) O-methyltransferase
MTGGDDAYWAQQREEMVTRDIEARGIREPRLLAAFRAVPRHQFVSDEQLDAAYEDRALPIPRAQTISQPYVVALMLEALDLRPSDRALDVGAGSGYAAALLSRLAREVFAIEREPELAALAQKRLTDLGYTNVAVRAGDGTLGWPEHAPFDAILVSAAAAFVPPALEAELAPGGRMVIPLGPVRGGQSLVLLTRAKTGELERRELCEVQFVPLVGATSPSR